MPRSNNCLNCETPLNGEFCSHCGQVNKGIDRVFLTLVNEAFEDVFRRNSRIWKTFYYLLFRPGLLTKEYCKGRRVRYVRPVKLYFFTSIVFFVTIAVMNFYSELSAFEATDSSLTSQQQSQSAENDAQLDEEIEEKEVEESSEQTQNDENQLDLDLPFNSESNFAKLVAQQINKIEQNPSQIESVLLEFAPPVIFCLLPLFAFLLKLSYLTKRIYYTEHLILALHNHSFLFFISTLNVILSFALQKFSAVGGPLAAVIYAWVPIYMWLSMKNIYQQSKVITTTKFLFLSMSYLILVICGIVLCFIFGVMTF